MKDRRPNRERELLALSEAHKEHAEQLRKRAHELEVRRWRRATTRRRLLDARYGRSPS